jgi:fructose-1-phosphate kinase PfkB-like protein
LFLTICLNPVLQKTIVLSSLQEDAVNRSSEYYFDLAGKGVHVSRVLAQLNEEVVHLTQAGGRFKYIFLSLAKEEKFKLIHVNSDADIRFCYTLLNKKKSTTTEIVEHGELISVDLEKNIFNRFEDLVPKCDWLVVSGTKAPGFSEELYPKMVKLAKEHGKTVFLDFHKEDLLNSLALSPHFIKLNAQEFFNTFFPDVPPYFSKSRSKLFELAHAKLIELYNKYGIHTIITNQENKIIYNYKDEILSWQPRAIIPINTTGCGDAFTAGFCSEYSRSEDMLRAVRKGEECARRNALMVQPGRIE